MNKKINIEELKLLLPDYITGQLNDADKENLEAALDESAELRNFYAEMKNTFDFVSNVKQEEPSPQYWTSLLPRIHQRIEEQESLKFSWDKVASIWKILVPVAAVILIALIYYLVKPSDTQMTKDEKTIEQINKDSVKDEEKPKQPDSKQHEQQELKQDNIVKQRENKTDKKQRISRFDEENTAKFELPQNDNKETPDPANENYSSIDVDETAIFSAGEAGGFDEELENELKELNDNEQDMLLRELQKSNL